MNCGMNKIEKGFVQSVYRATATSFDDVRAIYLRDVYKREIAFVVIVGTVDACARFACCRSHPRRYPGLRCFRLPPQPANEKE